MKHREAYVIFRKYSEAEMTSLRLSGSVVTSPAKLFAWSESRHAIKLFQMQRDQKKYAIKGVTIDDISELGSASTISELQLELISLKSNHLQKNVPFMTTAGEKNSFEAKIRQLFQDACSISSFIPAESDFELNALVNAIANFRPIYSQALDVIGYRNAELNYMFDSVDDADPPCDEYDYQKVGYGCTIGNIIIYSLESVVKVLLDEM